MENSSLKIYTIANLDCAHCASKIEKAISEIPEVEEVTLAFTTKKLRIKAVHSHKLFEKIQKLCDSIEPGTTIYEDNKNSPTVSHHEHEHEHHDCHHHEGHHEHCHCHEHDHHDEHGHSHDKHDEQKKKININTDLICISVGFLFIIASKIVPASSVISDILMLIAYAVLGGEILISAVKSIIRGKVFNEKFLMSVATLSAIALKDYQEAVGVMLFFRIGEYFEDIAVEKSRKSVMSVVDMRPETVNLINDDKIIVTDAEKIVPGQILLVRAGDRIPLDGIVTEGESCVDTSSITGEHLPVTITAGSEVLSGCINLQGVIKIKVTKPLSESMVTKIINSMENASAGKPQIDRLITRFANIYTPLVVIIAHLTAVIPSLITHEWHKWIYTAVTFLVISCPCAIVLSVPLTFFAGIGVASKNGILFKNGASIENLGKVKAVIMDKTGTITNGVFSVTGTVTYNGTDEKELLALCASCETNSTHPIAQSIVKKAKEQNISLLTPENIKEFAGMGVTASVNGKEIICGNEKLMQKYSIDISEYKKEKNTTDLICAVNGRLAGCFRISDTIKENSKNVISELKRNKIHTVMLTGDSQSSASDTAQKTGINEYFHSLLPDQKVSKMKQIREKYGKVMFIGDGINDAPVLAGADVSAAMGNGADAAVEAADAVFMNPDITSVSKAFSISRDTNNIVVQNIVFALAFKLAVMVMGFMGIANMWFAVFADSGVALLCVINSIRILKKKY